MSKRRNFSPEFKQRAVEQTRQPGVSCAQVARELGIAPNLLSRWRRDAAAEEQLALDGIKTPRAEDLRQLLDENVRQLRASEARYRAMFEANPHPMMVYSLDTLAFLAVNDAAVCHYGYSREAFLQMSIKDIRPIEDIPRLLANVEQVGKNDQAMDKAGVWQHITRDGRRIDVEIYSHTLQYEGQAAELVLAHDITDRLRAERALQESEAEFRSLIETMPQIVWVTRPDGWHLDFNKHWFDFTGLTLEESLGHGWNPAFHPEDQPRAARLWEEAITTGEPYEVEYRLRRADGVYRWMLGRALPLRDSNGSIVKWFGTCTDIHDLKRSQERLDDAQHIGKIGDWEYEVDSQTITWSPQMYEIFGRDPDMGPPQTLEENANHLAPSCRDLLASKLSLTIDSGEQQNYELLVEHPERPEVHVRVRAVPSKNHEGRVVRLHGTIQDITEEKLTERMLLTKAHQQQLVAGLGRFALTTTEIGQISSEVARTIAEGLNVDYSKVLLSNESGDFYTLTAGVGWSPEWIGRRTHQSSVAYSQIGHVIESQEPVIVDDFRKETRFSPSPLLIQHGIVSGINAVVQGINRSLGVLGAYACEAHQFSVDDIDFLQSLAATLSSAIERRHTDERLTHMAQHDALTGLPNRYLLTDRLNMALADARRHDKHPTVLFLDIDRFKTANDVYGHTFGDEILKQVAERLCGAVRATDTVSRQGGDEFLVVLPDVHNDEESEQVARKLLTTFTPPFQVGETEVVLNVSIGIARYPYDGQDTETLLRNADAAMYAAKDQGRNRYQFFAADIHARSMEHLLLEGDLHRAIENDQLFLEYQPQFNLATYAIVGLEALVRWHHPVHGMIPPDKFISIAEISGQIVPIGTWILEKACRQQAQWLDEKLEVGTIAVNVSAHQFQQPDFVDMVEAVLKRTGLAAERLELEVTERVVMQGMEVVLDKLDKLRELGIKLAIDDFGTGYSSMNYLKQFPLYRLKVDQSFIASLPDNRESLAIAEAIIHMGHSLGLDVLAEGIETPDQEALLRTLGCDAGQGYLYARPIPANELKAFVLSRDHLSPE